MIAQPQMGTGYGQPLKPVSTSPTSSQIAVPPEWRNVSGLSSIEGQVQVFTSVHRHFFTHVMSQALRDAGQGAAVLIVQFFKGGIERGPQNPTHLGQNLDWVRVRLAGSINAAPSTLEARQAILELWEFTRDAIQEERYEQVILEELSLAIFYGIVPESEVLELFRARPRYMDIMLIGQKMPQSIIKAANQVTELRNVFRIPTDYLPDAATALPPLAIASESSEPSVHPLAPKASPSGPFPSGPLSPSSQPTTQSTAPKAVRGTSKIAQSSKKSLVKQSPVPENPTPENPARESPEHLVVPGQMRIPGLD